MYEAERFDVFDNELTKKIIYTKDTKIHNAATLKIHKEDHTLGNLLRNQLLKDNKVTFAGYMVPHPLDQYIVIKIQTVESYDPLTVFSNAVHVLHKDAQTIHEKFLKSLREVKRSEIHH